MRRLGKLPSSQYDFRLRDHEVNIFSPDKEGGEDDENGGQETDEDSGKLDSGVSSATTEKSAERATTKAATVPVVVAKGTARNAYNMGS